MAKKYEGRFERLFVKASEVLDSCRTPEQFVVARKYIDVASKHEATTLVPGMPEAFEHLSWVASCRHRDCVNNLPFHRS